MFFLFLTLASNSFAWFIYSTKVSNSITAKVRSWHVNFNVGGGETTEEYIEVNIDAIYPGMQPFYQELKASNDGETDAKIIYEVVDANVLGDNLIAKGMSSLDIINSFKNDYPFTLSISVVFAVTIITGILFVSGTFLILLRIVKPSSSGSIISNNIKSGNLSATCL